MPREAPGEVLILTRAAGGAPGLTGSAGEAQAEGALREQARRSGVRVRELRRLCPPGAAGGLAARAWVLYYDGAEEPSRVAARLLEDHRVEYAGPNHLIPLDSAPGAGPASERSPEGVPNDPFYPEQAALFALHVPEAWTRSRGAGIRIAVIDTGIELDHPDLVARIAVNAAERDGLAGVDDDGNGYVDDIRGYDFTDAPGLPGLGDYLGRDPDPGDDHGHGTAVAGAAAATRDNGVGIAGVAPEAEILALRAGLRTTMPLLPALLEEDDAAAAILYAADNGARILNLSWGDLVEAPLIREAVRYARARGCLVVAGAGNTPADTAFYPAAHPGVVSVGACDASGERADFSTHGQDLDLVAPGTGVLVTTIGGSYGTAGGTSFSAPLAAGTAALLWSLHPDWTADEVAWRLRLSASGARDGWNGDLGWGLADAARAAAEGPAPAVAQIEGAWRDAANDASGARVFTGTIAGAGLQDWTLSVAPLAGASWEPGGFDRELPGERRLLRGAIHQAVAESLGVFTPGTADTGQWIARLRVRANGLPRIEERMRFAVTPAALDILDPGIEAQAAGDHWEILVWWRSRSPYQGFAEAALAGVADAEEATASTRHVLRLAGPIPAGTTAVRLAGRAEGESRRRELGEWTVEVPQLSMTGQEFARFDAPPGTPMSRAAAWDEGGENDLFVESPPVAETYGAVRWVETGGAQEPLAERGSSEGLFTGIPVDAADADGDGLGELAVFRLDGWSVWEGETPGGFPARRAHLQPEDGSVPVRFVTTPEGMGLLVVSGDALRMYCPRADGYELAGEASGGGGALKLHGEIADLDGDGRPEAVFADDAGAVILFRIGGSGLEQVARQSFAHPLSGRFLAIPGTMPAELLAASVEPSGPDAQDWPGRAAVRVARLAWTGSAFEERGAFSLAGWSAERELQFLAAGPGEALLRRGRRLDRLVLSEGGLDWGGALGPSPLTRVDGAVSTEEPGGARVVWLGGAGPEPGDGRLLLWLPAQPVDGLRRPRVASAEAIPEGLRLLLAWEDEGCGPTSTLWAASGGRPMPVATVTGFEAADTLAIGERVTYTVQNGDCRRPGLTVTALEPAPPPVLRWDGPGRILAEFVRPLVGPPQETWLAGAAGEITPAATLLDRSGSRLVVSFAPREAPDSLFFAGAVDSAGLPLGGMWDLALALPAQPSDSSVVLAEARYIREGWWAWVVASLRGTLPGSCTLRIEPGGGGETWTPGPGPQEVTIALKEPLPAGNYTLRIDPGCLPAGVSSLGLSRSFRVGMQIFPNPLRIGEPLTMENLEPGSRVELLDVSGRVRAAWRAERGRMSRPVEGLAPGLYFIRAQEAGSGSRVVRKLLLMR